MCAIIGIMATDAKKGLTRKQYKAFKTAWVRAEDRGRHASGFVLNINDELWYGKAEGPARKLIEDLPGWEDGSIKWAMGHTRWATHGSPSENINNHPIITGPDKDLLGIHNGVIFNKSAILKEHGWKAGREVDSEIAFRLLHHYGPESIKALNKLRGSANLCYAMHSKPDRFWLARMDNPLVVKEGHGYRAFGSNAYYWDGLAGKQSRPDDYTLQRWTPKGVIHKVIRQPRAIPAYDDIDVERDPSGRPIVSGLRPALRGGRVVSKVRWGVDGQGSWEIDENDNIVHIMH